MKEIEIPVAARAKETWGLFNAFGDNGVLAVSQKLDVGAQKLKQTLFLKGG